MQDLTLCLVQTFLHWEKPDANRAHFEELFSDIEGSPDLIILPEMFNTGFSMKAEELAEPMNLHTYKWLLNMAAQLNCHIGGSLIIKEENHYYNRFLCAGPKGELYQYDKRHLFSFAKEDKHYSPGKENIVIDINGWKIRPQICYDLRFPVWSRNSINETFDLLLYVANWPEARIKAWSSLLNARAIENACYTAGVNRTGKDEMGITYNGQSAVNDFLGDRILDCDIKEGLFNITLSKNRLMGYREKFPVLKDSDNFKILF